MIPDGPKIVADYLREHPDLVALNARVVTKMPEDTKSGPWVQVTQHDASDPHAKFEHDVAYWLQLDSYATDAGGHPQANLLNRTVRHVLKQMSQSSPEGVVVSRVSFTGNPRVPDTDFKPQRERYVLDARVYLHP